MIKKVRVTINLFLQDLPIADLRQYADTMDMNLEELETLKKIKNPTLLVREIIEALPIINEYIFEGSDYMVKVVSADLIEPPEGLKWE